MSEVEYSRDYDTQCAAWTAGRLGSYRKQCSLNVVHNIGGWIYLCKRHYEIIFEDFEERIDTLNSRRVKNMQERIDAYEAKRWMWEDDEAPDYSIEAHEARQRAKTVYFIRCQQYIKIGISDNPTNRLRQIQSGGGSLFPAGMDLTQTTLITTEPGGFIREKELHAKFAHLRVRGEWFTEAPELTDYINSLTKEQAA